jgi:hypothetical protein
MDTNELVRSLAADHASRARPLGWGLAVALVLALPFTLTMFMMRLGMRPDFMTATHNPFFVLKFVVTLALAFTSVALVMRLARPGADIRKAAWLLVIPLLLLGGGIAADMMLKDGSPWMMRMRGSNSMVCLSAIPMLSLPLLVAALIGLRRGAATRPMLTGAVAGLVAGGIAATFYASHCVDDSPLFVATWYVIAIAFVALVGALVGRKVLRW